MKTVILLMISFLLSSCTHTSNRSIASENLTTKIENELLSNFGIRIEAGGLKGSYESSRSTGLFGWGGTEDYTRRYNSKPGDSNYLNFINALLQETKKSTEGSFYFPENISILVLKQNSTFDDDIELSNSGIIRAHYSIKNAKNALKFLIANFPKVGSDDAREMKVRNRAIRTAIMDKIRILKNKNVQVKSCSFSGNHCRLEKKEDISYFDQEALLKALIHLEIRINDGKESRAAIDINEFRWSQEDTFKATPKWFSFKLKKKINKKFLEVVATYSAEDSN